MTGAIAPDDGPAYGSSVSAGLLGQLMLVTVPHAIDHAGNWALATLAASGPGFPALVARDRALELSSRPELGRPSSTAELLDRWDEVLPALDRLAGTADGWRPLDGLSVLPPVEPRQVFQAGANYRTHVIDIAVAHADGSDGRSVEQVRTDAAAEMDKRLEFPPYVFQGLPSAVCGPYDDVVLPYDGEQPDWELELAAVIGRRARRVSPDQALDDALAVMVNHDVKRLPVVEEDGTLVGIVAHADVLRHVEAERTENVFA